MNYYYLATSFPPLQIGEKPAQSFASFIDDLRLNLSKKDWRQTEVIRRWVDLNNIKTLLTMRKIDFCGNLTETELDEALLHQDGLPDYVFDVIKNKGDIEVFLERYPSLLASFFREELQKAKGFLKKFLTFEREARLVFLVLRAKESKRNLSKELQFEDPYDSFVAELLAQKDVASFDPPSEYLEIKKLWEANKDEPYQLAKSWIEYRFHKIEEMIEEEQFTANVVLAYLAQRILVEQWNALEEEEGKALFQRLKE